MRRIALLYLTALCFVGYIGSPAVAQNLTIQDISLAVSSYMDSINSIDIKFSDRGFATNLYADLAKVFDEEMRKNCYSKQIGHWMRNANRELFEIEAWSAPDEASLDGGPKFDYHYEKDSYDRLTRAVKQLIITADGSNRAILETLPEGSRFVTPTINPEHLYYLLFTGHGANGRRVALTLSDLLSSETTRIVEVNQDHVYVIEGNGLGGTYKIWLDATRAFLPVRIEKRAQGKLWGETVVELSKYGDFWFPRRAKGRWFDRITGDLLQEFNFDIFDVKINGSLEDTQLDFPFPPKTYVWDRIQGKEYWVQPD